MHYVIQGLDPAPFAPLFDASDDALAASGARRVTASTDSGFPCRVSLTDAKAGERLLLARHVSNDPQGPFHIAHAIYVREGAIRADPVRDTVPAMLDRRTLSIRAFSDEGLLVDARLAAPGTADAAIRDLFSGAGTAYVHAHHAAMGCFLANIERDQ